MPDIPGNSSTTATITVGGSVSDSLEVLGDHDWFRIELVAGQKITINLDGITLEDSYVYVRDAAGNLLAENDDVSSGVVRDSRLVFTATTTGTYYIDVGAFDEGYTGTYQLSVATYTPPPIATITQIANHLASGYWGGDSHHFNATQGGSISVNITGLTTDGQTLARAALILWSDIIGISFNEVATGGQITFDDNESGAFSDGTWSGGIISSAHVNVSTQWIADNGTSLNGYSFQTYIHEVGHALGLGHGGFYNTTADYQSDAIFANDGWPSTVMSYFDQQDSSYFANLGFNVNFIVTPMMADILAMSMLYGLSTTTRVGDTTYGPSWTNNMGALCIFDSAGTDTIDVSGYVGTQIVDLTPGTFSSIRGETGNVSIAFGVIIENAIGGSGNETIIGNAANNVLNGGGGEDMVSYATATAGVSVNLSIAAQQHTIGAGQDTLTGFERLTGSAFNDILTGSSTSIEILGGDGADHIISTGLGGHGLYGGNGDDWFVPGPGDDWMIGGDGFDTVDYSGASGPIYAVTEAAHNNTGNSGFDSLGTIEKIIGSAHNDTLWAFQVGHQAWGGAGDDILKGSGFGASELYGEAGNDTLTGFWGADILSGGTGNDSFLDTAANLNGDTITDFIAGDKIVITDATLAGFTFSVSGSTLTYTGGSLTLTGGVSGQLVASAAVGGGVQLSLQSVAGDVRNDFNGDGRSDILWRNSDGAIGDWLANPSGGHAANDASLNGVPSYWQIAGIGDFNGDGRDDILWRGDGGEVGNWTSNASGVFAYNAAAGINNVPISWQIAGVGDFNGDGRDDILWRNSDGTIGDWLANPSGGHAANDASIIGVPNYWQVASIGDFNGDGRDDILWRGDGGEVGNWTANASGVFAYNAAAGINNVPNSWHVQPEPFLL